MDAAQSTVSLHAEDPLGEDVIRDIKKEEEYHDRERVYLGYMKNRDHGTNHQDWGRR